MPFGFEFELRIPVYSLEGGKTRPPELTTRSRPRGQGGTHVSPKLGTAESGAFELSIEHQDRLNLHKSPGWPDGDHPQMTSLELATIPFDEMALGRDAVRQHIQDIADWATLLYTAVIGGAQLIDDCSANALVKRVNYLGPAPWLNGDPNVLVNGSIQETYGLRLDRVVKEFKARAEDLKYLQDQDRDAKRWFTCLTLATTTGPNARLTRALGLQNAGSLTPQGTSELQGLFALILYYSNILPTTANQPGLGKNRPGPFYYKTALSTVCRELRAKYPAVGAYLATNDAQLRQILLPLQSTEVEAWLPNVLAGISDSFFNISMNPWSDELLAPALGPANNQSVGVVIENRKYRYTAAAAERRAAVTTSYGSPPPFMLDTTLQYAPNEWPAIAVSLYDRLIALHSG